MLKRYLLYLNNYIFASISRFINDVLKKFSFVCMFTYIFYIKIVVSYPIFYLGSKNFPYMYQISYLYPYPYMYTLNLEIYLWSPTTYPFVGEMFLTALVGLLLNDYIVVCSIEWFNPKFVWEFFALTILLAISMIVLFSSL